MDSPEPRTAEPCGLATRLQRLHAAQASVQRPGLLLVAADALWRQLQGADPPLQAALATRLQHWLDRLEAQTPAAACAADAAALATRRPSAWSRLPLTRLTPAQAAAAPAPVLRGLAPLRQTWARIQARQRVQQGLQHSPANAGPLNPHKLALRTLALMDELSPDYLARMLHQLDALLWLQQSALSLPRRDGGAAPKTRAKRQ